MDFVYRFIIKRTHSDGTVLFETWDGADEDFSQAAMFEHLQDAIEMAKDTWQCFIDMGDPLSTIEVQLIFVQVSDKNKFQITT